MRTIFCDEAGYTGNKLMDDGQPFFAFASVEIAPAEADKYVADLCNVFKLASSELKGSKLYKTRRGEAVIRQIIDDHAGNAHAIVFDKKYCLACKMFEYLVEPVVSAVSSLLYEFGFHKFVANCLYSQMLDNGGSAGTVYHRFEEALRDRTDSKLLAVEDSITSLNVDGFIDQLLVFLVCNREVIAEEIVRPDPGRAGGWMLELSTTALRSLLVLHCPDMQPMEVFCDNSKPLEDQIESFSSMVGCTQKQGVPLAGQNRQLTFNLAGPIQLVDSSIAGIQLADIFASASVFAMNKPHHPLAQYWQEKSGQFFDHSSVLPEPAYIDVDRPRTIANYMIFQELLNRSLLAQDCCENLPAMIHRLRTAIASNSLIPIARN